ncbi:MAG: hypothetical protein RLZZ122_976 [Actinomycetota bacterium]
MIYAFIFSGLDGKTIILDLPTLRLAGPFRHVELLGNVSIEGLQRNFQLAIPFAAMILVFGILSLLVTESALAKLAWKAPFGKKIFTALGISLASINGIADSAREVFYARKLRREKRWSSLVPLLEGTIVKASATALRLSRSAAQPRVACDVEISNLRIGELGPISVVFQAGSIHVITGATGSGKSTLLQAVAGQTQEHFGREITGEIQLGQISLLSFEQASGLTSFVPQFPQDGLPHGKSVISNRLGHGLSHGEAYELAFEQELQRNPSVLLLDEPAAALDQERLSRLLSKCEELARLGVTVIIAEHRISAFTSLSASYWNLESGKLRPGMAVAEPMPVTRNKQVVGRESSIELDLPEIELGRITVGPFQLDLRQGETVAITGANGSGKTTLLNAIANARTGVFVHGVRFDGPDPRLIALVPDKVGDFFVTGSLDEELARADKVAQVPKGFTKETFLSLVQPEASDFTRHPLDLSIGTQLALATAMQLSHKPQLLLLDEPVQGLDSKARAQMAETLRCVQETGCAIVLATHDLHFAKALADKTITLSGDKRRDLEVIGK